MPVLCIFLFASASARDLSRMQYDASNPKLRTPPPLNQMRDVYLHYDWDPSILLESGKTEHEMVEYLMTLTDIMNQETFNGADFNLVTSSFSENSKDTDRYVMQEFRDQKVMREGEAHIWLHVTDYLASSIAGRFGLYDGAERSYAIAATFNGDRYTHNERTNPAHEIGHLFGLDHTHVLSLSYSSEVDVNPDQCGGGPNGADCSTKPAIGGSLMSYCQECPSIYNGGGFKSAKPLTSLHPFQAEKMREHFDQYKHQLPEISRQKLRTFIPDEARSNLCAREGRTCTCNGVVYFGPTLSSSNPMIFGVEHVSGSVQCSAGADKTFADVFHGRSKSCYCHEGADLRDITYIPTEVDFINGGTGECVVEGCGVRKNCYWEEYDGPQNTGYFTIEGQPEWKCKQECLDRTRCNAYNFKNGSCRLFDNQPSTVSNSGKFYGSTCWKRPVEDLQRHPQPAYQLRDIVVPGGGDGGDSEDCVGDCGDSNDEDDQYVMLEEGEVCSSEASLIETEEECLHAVAHLGMDVLRNAWNGSNRNKPAGCSFEDGRGKVHFNTYLQDVGKGRRTLAPICKLAPTTAEWSDWGSWSTCSVHCGGGMQTQYRTCLSGQCIGSNSRTQTCNNHACTGPVTCQFVAISSHQCPSGSLPTCGVNTNSGSLCKANLQQNGIAFVINNCGNTDVFRYVCDDSGNDSDDSDGGDNGGSNGHRYTNMGHGVCNTAGGSYIRGLAHLSLTADECKGFCDERANCVGYSSTNSSGRGVCYVHGPYTRNHKPDSTWYTSSGGDGEIATGNGLESMQCFKVTN